MDIIKGVEFSKRLENRFGKTLSKNAVDVTVLCVNSRRTSYCEKTHRVTDEKYILTINGRSVTVECSCEKGAFYALCDVVKRLDENRFYDGEYVCAPSFSVRGYIEGFYGTPWSHDSRKSVMSLMAKNRMNTVYYAPKDDRYHRELWREKYPDEELARLRELVDVAAEYYMDFYWCLAPGLSIKYSDDAEFEALLDKTKQLYSIGVRCFGLLLDDISEELEFSQDKARYGETVNAHVDLIERYYSALQSIDCSINLTVCPTVYHGKGDEYYISKLGVGISPFVSVFWTGRDICSRELTSFEALKFIECTHHKPLYWDNYPVNDCSMYNEMHVSPLINRDADLFKYSEGIISNCMEYAECSKIPLITVADYLWDSEGYNPQISWENAIKQVVGQENAESFIIFADHLYTSCLKDANSRRMYEAFDKIEEAFKAGDTEKAFALAKEYTDKMKVCREFLKSDLPLCREISKWSEKFFIFCDIVCKIFEYLKSKDESVANQLLALADTYVAMPARFSNDFDIKSELRDELGIS